MHRNIGFALAALPLILSACGTPQEQCIRRETNEYWVVNDLLEEVEANLSRGYAWEERLTTSTEFTLCRRVRRDKDGNAYVGSEGCWRDVTETERFRVPIDPAVEQRKRDNLAARKQALAPNAAASVQACKSAYPEEKR